MKSWLENLQKLPYPTPQPSNAQHKEPNVPLEFADLATLDAGDVSVGDRTVTGQISLVADAPHPIEEFIRKAEREQLNKGFVDPSWSEPVGVIEKTAQLGGMALATSLEVVKVNGEKQVHYFDATGKLVDVRILSKVESRRKYT